jgi:DNA polymerase elongation subunit (family B)
MTVADANPYLAANKEGALVKTYRWGLYKERVRDVDFTSFYPNLIVQLNLCPTTTRIIETRETIEPFSSRLSDDNHLILSIPDNRAAQQVIISIDMNKRGIAAEFVREMMTDRKAMKLKMKELDENSPEWTDLDVNQLNLKVIINALTGMFGLQSALFGSLASYIAITGTGRYILQSLKDHIGDDVISINTDGLYMTDFTPLSELNAWLESFIKEISFAEENFIWLEESFFEAAYFQPDAEKHYLLLRKSESGALELIIHGGGLKGSARIKLFSRALEELGMKMLTSNVTKGDVDALYERSSWTLEDLTFTRNCKPKSEYKNAGDLGMQLITQYEQRFKKELKGTAALSYVKIKERRGQGSYKLVTILDTIDEVTQQLDYEYYEDEIIKVLERLSLLHLNPRTRKQRSLFDFG